MNINSFQLKKCALELVEWRGREWRGGGMELMEPVDMNPSEIVGMNPEIAITKTGTFEN